MKKDEKDECGVFAKSPLLNFRLAGCPAATVPHIGHIVSHMFHDPARFCYASRAVLVPGLSFSLASYHCQLSLVVERVFIVAKLGSGVFAAQLDSLNKVLQGTNPIHIVQSSYLMLAPFLRNPSVKKKF